MKPFLFGVVFTLIYNSAYAIGGLLLGLAFWTIARSVNKGTTKSYLLISAIGIALLFSANHSSISVANAPYPPFGIASVWFLGLASCLAFTHQHYRLPVIRSCARKLEDLWRSNQVYYTLLEPQRWNIKFRRT